jgi:hypothetical protein
MSPKGGGSSWDGAQLDESHRWLRPSFSAQWGTHRFLRLFLSGLLFGDFGALLAGFGETNGDRLFLALHCPCLAALPGLEGAALFPVHCTFDALARGLSVLCHARPFALEGGQRVGTASRQSN